MKWPLLMSLFVVTLLDIDAQPPVQLSLKGIAYGNNSLVKMEDIGEGDEALICSTSFRLCCGTPPNRFGEWYYPDGSKVLPIGSGDTFYRNRLDDGTVRLHRRSSGVLPTDGRYRCAIPRRNQGDIANVFVHILSDNSIPRVTRQPLHRFNVDPGSTVSLSVVAVNVGVYQWQVNDTDADEGGKYQGTTTSTLMIHNIEENDEGFYLCIIGNEYISVRSDRAAVTVLNSPHIVENPEDQVGVEEGATAMFSVTVVGMKLTFNWIFQNGSQLPSDLKYSGQNTSILTIFFVSRDDSALYVCEVSNPAGSVVSQPARLSVFNVNLIERFGAIPNITSVLLTWALDEESLNSTSHFHLKYFPVLFPNMIILVNTTDTRYEAIHLIPQTTYVFELLPITEDNAASRSKSIEITLDKPLPPVENVSAALITETSARISWNMKHELPGWSSFYFNIYYSARSRDGLHSVSQQFEVSEISTDINLLVLEGDWQHQFQVSAVLTVGVEGLGIIESEKRKTILTIDLDEVLFQLLIGPTDYCIQWEMKKAKRYQLAIRQKMASILSTFCACNFSLHLIDDGVFSCRTFHNFVIYRSKISGFFASDMIQYLSEWVEMSPTLQVDWLLLNIHSSCSVRINSMDDPDCSMPLPSNTTDIKRYCN